MTMPDPTMPADPLSILIAEDDESLRECLRLVLGRSGHRVFTSQDGLAALEMARGLAHLDVLVSDLEMPRMRGDELAVRFRILHPDAAIVFISTSRPPTEIGAPFEFLAKPFTIDALLRSLDRALACRAHAA